MVFYKRSQDTRRGDAGIVQRMGKFDFAVFVVAVSQIGATSLPLGDVGAGVGFAVAVLRRCPRFQIILAVFGCAHIAGADFQYLIRQFQILQYFFRNSQQGFVPFFAFGNVIFANNELFGFQKLMDANQTARIFAGGSCFAAKTGGESGVEHRQVVFGKNFIGAQRIEHQFGRAGEVKVIGRHIIDFVLRKRQIAHSI